MTENDGRLKKAPYAIVILRILLTPAFFFAYMWDFIEIAICIYIVVFVSDIADGRLAKRLESTSSSPLEAYLDPISDFVFVLASFYGFTLRLIYTTWILVVFVFMFFYFFISSNKRKPIYDPVGKYYGTFLITTIGITLLFPLDLIYNGILLAIIVYTLGLAIYRTVFLWMSRIRIAE